MGWNEGRTPLSIWLVARCSTRAPAEEGHKQCRYRLQDRSTTLVTDKLKALLAIFSDDELLWFRTHLNDEGLSPERQEAHYRLMEAIRKELIERGLIN